MCVLRFRLSPSLGGGQSGSCWGPAQSLPASHSDMTSGVAEPLDGVGVFRRALPQVLACTANNLILFDNGLVISISTIVLAALQEATEGLSLNTAQATWFASIPFIVQPLGSLVSGFVFEPIGRKRSMMLLNIPFFCAWLLLYFSQTVAYLYASAAILGFGVGCTEAPILTYVGEITEPKYRGILASYAQLCGSFAFVVLYAIGYITTWRNTTLFCAAVPLFTFVAVSMIPETPIWLISRGRIKDAEKALCWLRGWVTPDIVAKELNEMVLYYNETSSKHSKQDSSLQSTDDLMAEQMSRWDKVKDFFRPTMRRPLILIILYFFFFYATGLQTIRPYMVSVYTELKMPMDPKQATVLVSLLSFVGNIVCMALVASIGKKKLSLVSLLACAVSTLLLAVVAKGYLTSDWPLPLFLLLAFFTGLGVSPIPWMLQSELYPFRGKSLAAGIASAASYIIGFTVTKSYLYLTSVFQLYGMFLTFGVLSIIGALFLTRKMPETEGKTLSEIEAFFKGKSKSKTQRK